MVISAIDGFAVFLTGERYYFSIDGSGATDGQLAKRTKRPKHARAASSVGGVTYFVAMPFCRGDDG